MNAAPDRTTPMLNVALGLAEHGFRVIPLHTPQGQGCSCGKPCGRNAGKHPRIKGWEKAASADPAVVRAWWRMWPDANVGIKTGPGSGIVVVDVDPGRGGEETWRSIVAEYGPIAGTWVCLTGGGGQHLYFRHPGGELHDCLLGDGIELRADGGQVVGPGSTHRSGRRYEWELSSTPEAVALADLPARLVDSIRPKKEASEPGDGFVSPDGPRVPTGILLRRALERMRADGRNNTGLWLACQLRDNRYGIEEARVALSDYAARAPGMPDADGVIHEYTDEEAQHSVDEAYKRPPRQPWAPLGGPDEATKRAERPEAEPRTLADVVTVVRRWLYVDEAGIGAVYAVLGTVAANLFDSDPVWLLVIGPPSGGKTEIINAITGLPNVHPVATLTEAGLLSGTSRKESEGGSGGLLRQIGSFGVVLAKDFTSVLAMHPETRASLLAALREVYDGNWVRTLGTDGGKRLAWSGKVGLVGACTPIYDVHHAVVAAMGDRFLSYRLGEPDRRKQVARALVNGGDEARMRREIAEVVHGLFAGLEIPAEMPALDETTALRLGALADFASRARSHVERDSRSREVELIPPAEMPARIAQALRRLLAGLAVIGLDADAAWRVVGKTALDCIPQVRRDAAAVLLEAGKPLETGDIAKALDYPSTTIRRALEDLVAHRVVGKTGFGSGARSEWWLTQWALDALAEAGVDLTRSQPGEYGK